MRSGQLWAKQLDVQFDLADPDQLGAVRLGPCGARSCSDSFVRVWNRTRISFSQNREYRALHRLAHDAECIQHVLVYVTGFFWRTESGSDSGIRSGWDWFFLTGILLIGLTGTVQSDIFILDF